MIRNARGAPWFLLLTPAIASAHPFGEKFAAHNLTLRVDADGVDVHYIADVPDGILQASTPRGADPIPAMTRELLSGLVLEVDGTPRPLLVVSGAEVQTNDDSHQIGLRLRTELTQAPRTVEISNANLPDVPGYFATSITVGGGARVSESSVLLLRDGQVVRNEDGRWKLGDAGRRADVALVQPPRWWRAIGPAASLTPTPVGDALVPSVADHLRGPIVDPGVGGLALFLASLSGAFSAAPPRTARLPLVVAAAATLAGATWMPSPWVELVGGAFAVAAVLGLWRRWPAADHLLAGAIAVGTHSVVLAALTLLVHGIATALPTDSRRPWPRVALGVLVCAISFSRAMGPWLSLSG